MTRSASRAWWRVVASLALACSLLVGGAAGGWWLRGRFGQEPERTQVAVAVNRPIIAIGDERALAENTPNVIGLTAAQATAVFLDAGYTAEAIIESPTPAGGSPGVIVGQEPQPRAAATGQVVLYVAEATSTPRLVGLSVEDARARLRELGARAAIRRDYDPDVAEGEVLASSPAAGDTLPDEVELVVSEAPSAVFLRSLREEDSDDCRTNRVTIGDDTFAESFVCTASNEGAFLTYLVTPGIARLSTVVAHSVQNTEDLPITVIVVADGETVQELVIEQDERVELDVDVGGSTEVTIRFVHQSTESVSARVLVGDPVLVGSRQAVDAIVATIGR